MTTPKQRAELAARECSFEIAKLVELKQFESQVKEIDDCIANSLPLEQLFAVEDALREIVNEDEKIMSDSSISDMISKEYHVKHTQLQDILLTLDNWRKEREKK